MTIDSPAEPPIPTSGKIPVTNIDVRHNNYWLTATIIITILVQGSFFFFRPSIPPSPDEREYISLAIHLAEKDRLILPDGTVAKRMPVYPLLLSWVRRWQGPDLWTNSALLLQTGLACCTTIIIASIAKRLSDARGGFVAGIATALYSPFLFLQMSFLTEGLLIFLLAVSILVYISWVLPNRSTAQQLCGLLCISALIGIATLTRPNALLFLAPFLIDTVARKNAVSLRALQIFTLLIPAAICAIGWSTRNQQEIGAFTLSTSGGLNFYLGNNPAFGDNPTVDHADYNAFDRLRLQEGLSELATDKRLYEMGSQFIRENPGETAANVFRKIAVWFTPSVPSQGPTLIILITTLAVTAGWRPWRRGTMSATSKLFFVTATILLLISLVTWLLRLRETILPFTTPLYVLSLGVPALLFLPVPRRIKWLFIGLVSTQLLTAVVYIPLTRIRWTIDAIFIIAIAIWTSHLCRAMSTRTNSASHS